MNYYLAVFIFTANFFDVNESKKITKTICFDTKCAVKSDLYKNMRTYVRCPLSFRRSVLCHDGTEKCLFNSITGKASCSVANPPKTPIPDNSIYGLSLVIKLIVPTIVSVIVLCAFFICWKRKRACFGESFCSNGGHVAYVELATDKIKTAVL